MRTRRQIIMASGTSVALGLSGCLQEPPDEEENGDGSEPEDGGDGGEMEDGEDEETEDGETEDGAEEEEPEPEPASFEVTSVEAPASVEIGQEFRWSFTVRNEGEVDGVFETDVTRRRGGNEPEAQDSLSVEVPAGEEVSTGATTSHDFLGEYVYTLEETGDEFGVSAVKRELDLGETYVNPDEVSITVESTRLDSKIEIEGSYSYVVEGEGRVPHRAGRNMRFAYISVTSQKQRREKKELPRAEEFVMVINDEEEYESTERRADDAYTGGPSRVSREGVVMFEIDERFDRTDNFDIYWTRAYSEGTAEAVWST